MKPFFQDLTAMLDNTYNKRATRSKSIDDTDITSQCYDTRIRHAGKLQKNLSPFPRLEGCDLVPYRSQEQHIYLSRPNDEVTAVLLRQL